MGKNISKAGKSIRDGFQSPLSGVPQEQQSTQT